VAEVNGNIQFNSSHYNYMGGDNNNVFGVVKK